MSALPVKLPAIEIGTRREGMALLIAGVTGMVMGLVIEEPVGVLLFAALAAFGLYLYRSRPSGARRRFLETADGFRTRNLLAGAAALAVMACGQPKPDSAAGAPRRDDPDAGQRCDHRCHDGCHDHLAYQQGW
jgi:hypothetical protein